MPWIFGAFICILQSGKTFRCCPSLEATTVELVRSGAGNVCIVGVEANVCIAIFRCVCRVLREDSCADWADCRGVIVEFDVR